MRAAVAAGMVLQEQMPSELSLTPHKSPRGVLASALPGVP